MKKIITLKTLLSLLLALSMIFAVVSFTSCSFIEDYMDLIGNKDKNDKDDEDDGDNKERNEFIDGIGGVSETFEGAVSEKSYDTPEDAVEAYIFEEVAGQADAVVLDTESKGELSKKEISSLKIPEDFLEDMVAVEEYEVSYALSEDADAMSGNGLSYDQLKSDKLNKNKKVTVYVIKYTVDWKYFTPAPITGDTISQSYYNSVFNAEKYKNCTMEHSMELTVDMQGTENGQAVNMTMEMNTRQLIKHADGKVYLEQVIESKQDGKTSTNTIYAYLEEVDGKLVCYVKTDPKSDEWMPTDLRNIGFTSLDQLTPFHDQYLDYTYFTKTNYGFALEDENAELYFNQVMGSMAGLGTLPDMDIDMFAEYYVSEGVLSGMRMDIDVEFEVADGGSVVSAKETAVGITTCTDYGTTVVTKPFSE